MKIREIDKEYILLQKNIKKFPFTSTTENSIEDKLSWFNRKTTDITCNFPNIKLNSKIKTKLPKDIRKTIQVKLLLTDEQKTIFQKWIKAYITMYNETLKYIKASTNINVNFMDLRTNHLKSIRDVIIKNSQIDNLQKDTKIKTHVIDTAIKLACSNYKSAMTNKTRGNIKHFRIRYWRYNKTSCTIEVEQSYFRQNTICKKVFGNIICENNFQLDRVSDTYKTSCFIRYNKIDNSYILFIPEKVKKENLEHQNEFIAIDPGIINFMTCITNKNYITFGENNYKDIISKIEFIDKIDKKSDISKKKKKKILIREKNKINNKINELHWQTINNLTKNYKNILIGDMSVKRIINRKNSNLNKMIKRVALKFKFFVFSQRLQFKCSQRNCNLYIVNEKYTSKTCNKCGNYNEKLGNSRIYNCSKCHNTEDRDINGCKCILLKCL